MSAYFEQGFSVRETPWHGLGHVISDYPGREAAMQLAGHAFTVEERPIWIGTEVGQVGDKPFFGIPSARDGGPVIENAAEGFKALVRSDTGHLLSVQKDSYGVIQPSVIWDIADALVGQPNVKYETAGVLKEGAVLWVLAWLDEPIVVPGDTSPTYPWICVSTTNDGSGACKADATAIRVVCWNTFSATRRTADNSGHTFTFRHTRNVRDRVEEARAALHGTRSEFAAFAELTDELVGLRVNSNGVDRFLSEFIPLPAADIISERVRDNVERARGDVLRILNNGLGTLDPAVRNTAYGLLQAGTEYLDHIRVARTAETKLGRSLLRQESLKSKLVPLVRSIAKEHAA